MRFNVFELQFFGLGPAEIQLLVDADLASPSRSNERYLRNKNWNTYKGEYGEEVKKLRKGVARITTGLRKLDKIFGGGIMTENFAITVNLVCFLHMYPLPLPSHNVLSVALTFLSPRATSDPNELMRLHISTNLHDVQ